MQRKLFNAIYHLFIGEEQKEMIPEPITGPRHQETLSSVYDEDEDDEFVPCDEDEWE